MFKSVLIANRGEVACRIARTCRMLGIRTVAVYSDADRGALHVELADEAHHIGPSPVSESYLNMDAVLDVARLSRAEAVHPGYGLLSENAEFARRCAERGLVFIGPSPAVITAMANKVRARAHALAADFPVVPGTEGAVDGDVLLAARTVGFPLMVKASAGGGGIGMTIVDSDEDLGRAVTRARSMAERAFGDPEIYLERYLGSSRHVEVQVLGDARGNSTHLWHRECSVQRRHQKVIEEAPVPHLPAEISSSLTGAAVRLANALGYTGAGTVECLLDASGTFYFLEVNTRLQVEHPVTEMVTGVDLVEQQLLVAAGEPVSVAGSESKPSGHAIECRIYAEDPITHMPAPGPITEMTFPQGEGIRLDTGFRSGDVISPYYDPLVAKLVVWGEDRAGAVARLAGVLRDARIEGTKTNLPLLREVLDYDEFRDGHYDTGILQRLAAAR